jgi:hypothetical protein
VRKEKIDTIFLIKAENEANNGFMVKFPNEKQGNCSLFNLRIRFFKRFQKHIKLDFIENLSSRA